MGAQDPRARPSCYEIMRLTEILLAQAKRRCGKEPAAGAAGSSVVPHHDAACAGTAGVEGRAAAGAAAKLGHLRRFSSEAPPLDR